MEQSATPQPPSMPLPYLQCVGKTDIVRPKPVDILCGSIPVFANYSLTAFTSALLPSTSQETVTAPRYQFIPMKTDLNRPPLLTDFHESVLPLAAVKSRITGDISKEANVVASNLSKKCEALAALGLVQYGNGIDVIAPVDILKQIFKIPYSKARVSIEVQLVGQTLVLNPGPDVEEGEKLIRRHNNQPKCTKNVDESLFLNFALHSVRMEACDISPMHRPPTEKHSSLSALPAGENSHGLRKNCNSALDDILDNPPGSSKQSKQDGFISQKKKSKTNKAREPVRKNTQISEKIKHSGDSAKHRRVGSNEFLNVLFWQFNNFRMLLGSDLLLFRNEKYVAVSLHLWDASQKVTPLTWLEAWLDNVMASVPELLSCYHKNGIVQQYELLKTDEIFLLKGISKDRTPAFNPHVVQQNGLSVLTFLQSNCKEDPGAYWLYKSAGEDVIQLFDLSIIPTNHSSSAHNNSASSLPSLIHSWRSDAISKALALYESLGKQEAKYAYLELAMYHTECCLGFLETERQGSPLKPQTNDIQRAKQYAMLANENWQKSMEFDGPENNPSVFLMILTQRSALYSGVSKFWQENVMLESALSCLLEGRQVSKTDAEGLKTVNPGKVYTKFWAQLQTILLEMLKSQTCGTSEGSRKLRELYKASLKSTNLSDLEAMHVLWTSST